MGGRRLPAGFLPLCLFLLVSETVSLSKVALFLIFSSAVQMRDYYHVFSHLFPSNTCIEYNVKQYLMIVQYLGL